MPQYWRKPKFCRHVDLGLWEELIMALLPEFTSFLFALYFMLQSTACLESSFGQQQDLGLKLPSTANQVTVSVFCKL